MGSDIIREGDKNELKLRLIHYLSNSSALEYKTLLHLEKAVRDFQTHLLKFII